MSNNILLTLRLAKGVEMASLLSRSFQPNLVKIPRFCLHNSARALRQSSLLSNEQVRKKRSSMFTEELNRQKQLIPRIEKIEVEYEGIPDNATLILNKGLSTPYNVAQHLSSMLMDRSALALVNDQLWDMHRPLEEDCTVKLLHFHMDDPFHVNRAFWRSCSFLLGAALETAFRDDIFVELHSFPPANVASGSFVHDVDLKLGHDWEPGKDELMVFSAMMHRMAEKSLKFERLVVDAALAERMFGDSQYKSAQIPSIASSSSGGKSITLYRVGDHVDISAGPMVGDTSFLGRRCTVPVAHKIVHNGVPMYRFQGVALPKGLYLNHFAFSVLEKRASRLNAANLQSTQVVNPA